MASNLPSQNVFSNGGCFQQCFGIGAYSFSAGANGKNTRSDATLKSTEDFLASEMSKLSVEERSKALDDLHCVGEDLKETPEMIETKLADFDDFLRKRNAPIYKIAASQNHSYVEDPAFRLRFLRANHHNVTQAVSKMIGFLSCKEKYFGREAIARDITLEELVAEEIALLLSGVFHIQDSRDRSGRVVLFLLNDVFNRFMPTAESFIRVYYFIFFNILSPMPSVQAKGIVLCYYDFSTPEKFVKLPPLDFMLKFIEFSTKMPVHRSAVHGCLKPVPGSIASKSPILDNIFKSFQRSTRTRSRLHYGSDIELQYTLQSYGFNLETFPVDSTGNLRRDILNAWFSKYVHQREFSFASGTGSSQRVLSAPDLCPEGMMDEVIGPRFLDNNISADSVVQSAVHRVAQSDSGMHCLVSSVDSRLIIEQRSNDALMGPTFFMGDATDSIVRPLIAQHELNYPAKNTVDNLIIEPTSDHVLMGKGRGFQTNPGNIRFREFVKKYQDDYNNTPRYKRVSTPTELTRVLLGMGIRFLKKTESGGWVESDFAEVEKKVKQLFRSQKKYKKKQDD